MRIQENRTAPPLETDEYLKTVLANSPNFGRSAVAHSKSSQTSKLEPFGKIVNGSKPFNIFAKSSPY